ncbi:MAG: hypothetical protein F7C07_03615 [Desulfurococcales archaeon]|nr:hypothetical protein [Desulfurococcales archaeon]
MSGGKNFCIPKTEFSHNEEEVHKALGLNTEEKDAALKLVSEAIKRAKISEMLEYIWSDNCESLSVKAKIYATFRLGMDVYSIILERALRSAGGEGGSG